MQHAAPVSPSRRISRHVLTSLVGTLLVLGSIGPASAQPATPIDLGCTVWRTGADSPVAPESCSQSPPWWESWSDCAMTPVHGERWPLAPPSPNALTVIPWIQVEPATLGMTGHLFFGNRPLPVGGTFANGDNAKVLWITARPISRLTITADNPDDPAADPVPVHDAGGTGTASTQWPSVISLPSAGCWRLRLELTSLDGRQDIGNVTYIVVE